MSITDVYCISCGNKIDSEDEFCSKCGSKIIRMTKGQVVVEPRVVKEKHPLENIGFWEVYAHGRTYLNQLYLLLLFPIGIILFVYSVTCFSTFVGLIPIVVGFFLLYFFLLSLPFLMKGQAWLMKAFVGIEFKQPETELKSEEEDNFFNKAMNALKNKVIIKSLLYNLFIAMPLGIIIFTLQVTLLSVSVGFIFNWIGFIVNYSDIPSAWFSVFPTWAWIVVSVLTSFIGIFLLTVSLHLLNRIAIYHGRFVKKLMIK
ncbi:MAG: zinc-ribbon domain-containing protein [Asgard group archaeon]|nr:zinc-ribbon domain-containing protein [Asgard group archaeon]